RHHKVAQVGAALRYGCGEVLRPVLTNCRESDPLGRFVMDLEAILSFNDDEAEYDAEQTRDLLDRFAGYDDQWWMGQLREHQPDEWLNRVCWRTPGPRCLWKRAVDFPAESIAEWNEQLPGRLDAEGRRQWDSAVRELREDGVLVVRHFFQPWRASSE